MAKEERRDRKRERKSTEGVEHKKESNENFEKKELRVTEGKKLKYNHVRTNWRKEGGGWKMKARKSERRKLGEKDSGNRGNKRGEVKAEER